MYSLIFLAVCSWLLSLALTPLVSVLARRWGIVDLPDSTRKLHLRPIPRVGGIAVTAAFVLTFGLWLLTPLKAVETVFLGNLGLIARIVPSVLLVFAVGLWDDIRGVSPWVKLGGQTIAALGAYLVGLRVDSLAGSPVDGIPSLALTVFWLLLCTNAFNLIDGMDGLAAGLGLIAALTMLVNAVLQDNMSLALAVIALAGSLLGFLRYNLPPASIFLGDCGSMMIGFVLGCCGVAWSQKCVTLVGMLAPVMAVAVPLLDVTLSIGRRLVTGKPIFSADRRHIHHLLLDRGLTTKGAVLLLYGVTFAAALLALGQSIFAGRFDSLAAILFLGLIVLGIQSLRYNEFETARRLLTSGAFQRMVASEIATQQICRRLTASSGPDEVWQVLISGLPSLGLSALNGRILGKDHTWSGHDQAENAWSVQLPLAGGDWIGLRVIVKPGHAAIDSRTLTALQIALNEAIGRSFGPDATADPNLSVESAAAGR